MGRSRTTTNSWLRTRQAVFTAIFPDGEKLLYIGYGYEEYDEYGAGSIYLSRLDLPPEVYDQVKLEGDKLIRGIRPVWKADLEGIYYIISEGIMSYNSSEEQVNNVVPVGELSGLVQENRLAPHAFHMVFQAD